VLKKNSQSIVDLNISKVHDSLFRKHRWTMVTVSLLVYIFVILALGGKLRVSNNYIVLLPVISISLSFGFLGGFISGSLALPANLLLFYFLGHLNYSPESKMMAEISGILLGSVLGYLSDFFTQVKEEIQRRKSTEAALSKALKEKELLLREIHHRVKNNLNLIKSITQLQSNRIDNELVYNECNKLNQRILSISLVQDLLFTSNYSDKLNINEYITQLVESLLESHHSKQMQWEFICQEEPILVHNKRATSIGLIINEGLVNCFKYAFNNHPSPKLFIELLPIDENFVLKIGDNGPGYPEDEECGLGKKLIPSLAAQLKGSVEFVNDNGAWIIVRFPKNE
jgi:two-component sensor histidine kinase